MRNNKNKKRMQDLIEQMEIERIKFEEEMKNPAQCKKKDDTNRKWANVALKELRALKFVKSNEHIYFQNVRRTGYMHYGAPLPPCFRIEAPLLKYINKNADEGKIIRDIIEYYFIITSVTLDENNGVEELYIFVEFDLGNYRKNVIKEVE